MPRILLLLAAVLACRSTEPLGNAITRSNSDRPNTTTFTRSSGGSMTTTLGYGIKVNPASSLEREWITAHDSLAPVDLRGTVGVVTTYKAGGDYSTGEYEYQATIPLAFKEDVVAFEIRFVLFDLWGQFTKTLSYTEVEHEAAGSTKSFSASWSVYSENEVSEHYASLAYVARVRTKAGRVFEANYSPVVDEARTISARFQPEWLDPTGTLRPDSVKHSR